MAPHYLLWEEKGGVAVILEKHNGIFIKDRFLSCARLTWMFGMFSVVININRSVEKCG